MRPILFYIVSVIILTGCSQCQTNPTAEDGLSPNEKANLNFKKAKLFFSDSLINHFPKTIVGNTFLFRDCYSPDIGIVGMTLVMKTDASAIKTIVNGPFIGIFESADSCVFMINFKNTGGLNKDKKRNCIGPKVPIPSFTGLKEYSSNKTITGLSDEYKIYVISAKKGRFLNEEYLSTITDTALGWENGFSRGYAVNAESKTVIYWLIIW